MVHQYKNQVDNLMQREVSRGDFLKFVGVALLGITGVVGFFKNLHDASPSQPSGKKHTSGAGYGSSAYGR